jgi:hypothetical protein
LNKIIFDINYNLTTINNIENSKLFSLILEAISKTGFWFKIKTRPRFNPPRLLTGSSTRILKYSEELKRGPNTEIEPKGVFEMVSNDRVEGGHG